MSLRAVIFDFGGVLCFPPTTEQLSEAAALCGLSLPEFVDAFWHKRREYDRGNAPAVYWRDIGQSSPNPFDDAMVAEMIRREIDFWSRFDQRMLNWIADLRNTGLRTSILSNLPKPLGERLHEIPGFLDHFDQVTFSYELGVIKPEPEIYEYALRGLGVAPSEALFFDDREENIEGARAIGLQAELFTTWENLVEQIESEPRLETLRYPLRMR
jgi:putative hydrolase of the HAD superfamily